MSTEYHRSAPYTYKPDHTIWYFCTVLYIILDYTRIYEVLGLGVVRPLMITTLVLAYYVISSGTYYLSMSKQRFFVWLFILLLSCYIPFAVNEFRAYMTTKSLLLYMPFILSVIVTVNSMHRLKNFLLILIVVEIYISIYALTHVGYGPGNYFNDENDLALYVNMWIPFCYFLFFSYKSVLKRMVCLTGLIIGLLSIIISFSRGGFVGLIAMGGVLWLFSRKKIVSLLLIATLIGIMFMYAGDEYWQEMATSTNATEGTGKERVEFWKSSLIMFINNPLGVGGNNFQVRFPEYQTEYFGERNMWGKVAHSIWFTLIPETGVLGIYIYLALLYYNIKDIFWLNRFSYFRMDADKQFLGSTGRAFIAAFAGYFAAGSFISVLYYAHYWYFIGFILAVMNIARGVLKRPEKTSGAAYGYARK